MSAFWDAIRDALPWENIDTIATAGLGFLGLFVSFTKNLTERKGAQWAFAAAFFILTVVAWCSGQEVKRADNIEHQQEMAKLTGGDNYVYLWALLQPENLQGPFPLITRGTGPIYDAVWFVSPLEVNGDSNNPKYWTSDHLRSPIPVIYPDSSVPGQYIGVGAWRIEWRLKGAGFRQELHIFQCNGRLVQQAIVLRNEKEIFSTPPPLECVK